ncbi:hypothetical protein CBR_g46596 [Chara braunii]|uniref:Integrase zinc-binding domain-containing protein n=1 Tax=Chara braunii TaxID=69332 RepID=A0A388M0K8_CHABU|nr:hypothetical protein CBR_g46596 [Chara braunii]|eukprot:GBG88107.1 hypothetical protein CBR_g46596 [Chara braunii]
MVVPHPFMRYDWVKTTHEETAAHFAVRITESAIDKNEWYWSNIRDDVKYIFANCQVCAADKAPIQPRRSIVPTVVERPFQRVSMDTTDIVVLPGPNSWDITTIPPAIHSDIYRTLRVWAGEVPAAWTDLLARRGDTIVPAHDTDFQLRSSRRSPSIVLSELRAAPTSHRLVSYLGLPSSIPTLWQSARDPTLSYRVKENSAPLLSEEKWNTRWEDYIELAFYLLKIEFHWSETVPFGQGLEHPEDSVELLIIQASRTAEQGDLLGFIFEKVEEGNLTLITDKLLVFLTQLVDDLPLDILSRSDEQPDTHVLSRTLEPHLV